MKARCGGPGLCKKCEGEAILVHGEVKGAVTIYSLGIRNKTSGNIRQLYGTVTPNVIDQYWEAYAESLESDEELVIDVTGRWKDESDG